MRIDDPDWRRAEVHERKLDFLLDRARRHDRDPRRRDADKSWLFVGVLGFTDSALLRSSLIAHANNCMVVSARPVQRVGGTNYEVRGAFVGQNDRQMILLTIWCVLIGESTPRFVTAYPAARRTGARIRP